MADVREMSLRNAAPICYPVTDKSESVYSYCWGIFHFSTPNARDYTITKSLPMKLLSVELLLYDVFKLQDVFGDKPLRTRTEQLYFTFLTEIQFC